MNAVQKLLTSLGPTRLIAALVVTAIVAAALFALVFRVGGEEKSLLFANLDMAEAGEITTRLQAADIPYELRGDGSAIFVPRSQVLDARMMLSAEGLPSQGSVGYEIFDRQDALGATQFQQNMQRLRALEGELARTIASIEGVEKARVHLVLPERRLFERDQEQPSASIVVTLRGDMAPGHVRAIRNLVAGATPGLEPGRVTILDADGRLLADGAGDGAALDADGVDARQTAVEERIRKTVLDIVESVVGPGAARVQVSAEMDFNRITERSEVFDPEGRVVRSTTTVEENNQSRERDETGGATAARNLPDGAGGADDAGFAGSTGARTEETINYDISKTEKTEIVEGGRVRRISVAVAVDGVTTPAEDANAPPTWAPREAEELERIATLVRSAVGFSEARGDTVEVVNVRFARPPALGTEASADALTLQSSDFLRIGEIAAALVAALALVFFVLRPLIGGLLKPAAPKATAAPQLAAPTNAIAQALEGAGEPSASPLALPEPDRERIDLARIKGKVSASSVKQVAEIVEQHPEESVTILRGWLNNAA